MGYVTAGPWQGGALDEWQPGEGQIRALSQLYPFQAERCRQSLHLLVFSYLGFLIYK